MKRVLASNEEIAPVSTMEESISSDEDESTIQHWKREQVPISTEEEGDNQYWGRELGSALG
jgi:hypothetical protein